MLVLIFVHAFLYSIGHNHDDEFEKHKANKK